MSYLSRALFDVAYYNTMLATRCMQIIATDGPQNSLQNQVSALLGDSADFHSGSLSAVVVACNFWMDHLEVAQNIDMNTIHGLVKSQLGVPALLAAVIKGHGNVCRMLLASHASYHAGADYVRAAESPKYLLSPLLYEAAKRGYADVCEALLEEGGADVNCRVHLSDGENSTTALHVACWYSNVDVIKILLKYRADCHAKDSGGNIPSYYATGEAFHVVYEYMKTLKDTEEESEMVRIYLDRHVS